MAIKAEGGGGKALMARPFREELFFAASLSGSGGLPLPLLVNRPLNIFFKNVCVFPYIICRHKKQCTFKYLQNYSNYYAGKLIRRLLREAAKNCSLNGPLNGPDIKRRFFLRLP